MSWWCIYSIKVISASCVAVSWILEQPGSHLIAVYERTDLFQKL